MSNNNKHRSAAAAAAAETNTSKIQRILLMILLIVLVMPVVQQHNDATVVVVEGHFMWADTTTRGTTDTISRPTQDKDDKKLAAATTSATDDNDDDATEREEEEEAEDVVVTFSEQAGVHDKIIGILSDRVQSMKCYTPDTTNSENVVINDVPLSLSEDKSYLTGTLIQATTMTKTGDDNDHDNTASSGGPEYVYGYLDFGPFGKFQDLQYAFGAQSYQSDSDYDTFFRPLLKKMTQGHSGGEKNKNKNKNKNNDNDNDNDNDNGDNDTATTTVTPAIVLRNCGGDGSGSYQFDVAGFTTEGGPLGVCLYQKGGIEVGCGTFAVPSLSSFIMTRTIDHRRQLLRSNTNNNKKEDVDDDSEVNDRDNTKKADIDDFGYYHITTTHDTLEQHQQQGPETEALTTPYLLYALANQTVVDTNSGNTTIMFASTSVYFEGTCKQ